MRWAMLAIGILAYQPGGRAFWMLPSVFVMVMAIGWALGVVGIQLPYVEASIAVSVVVFGGAILFALKSSVTICAALARLFALFHGYAHGVAMPAGPAAPYAAGFIAASVLLHVAGIGFGLAIGGVGRRSETALRAAGLVIAVIGMAILLPIA